MDFRKTTGKIKKKVKKKYPVKKACRKILAKHFHRFLKFESRKCLGRGTEDVHQMRVSSRRMRVLLKNTRSYLPEKQVKILRKGLKKVANTLGEIRDLDTFQAFLARCEDEIPNSERANLENLKQSLSVQREEKIKSLHAQFRNDAHKDLKKSMGKFISKNHDTDSRPQVKTEIPKVLNALLTKILAYDAIILNAKPKEYHNLRILFKHFRYMCEFFQSCYGKKIKPIIVTATRAQDYLGEVQDKNRDIQFLRENSTRVFGPNIELNQEALLNTLIEKMEMAKKKNLDDFFALWREFKNEDSVSHMRAAFDQMD